MVRRIRKSSEAFIITEIYVVVEICCCGLYSINAIGNVLMCVCHCADNWKNFTPYHSVPSILTVVKTISLLINVIINANCVLLINQIINNKKREELMQNGFCYI